MQYFGENGLIAKAEKAKELHEQEKREEELELGNYIEYMGDYLNGYNGGNIGGDNPSIPEPPDLPETPKGPNGNPLVNKDTVNETDHEKIVGEDSLGNEVVVPEGFKIAEESGTSVKEGIIIEDAEGNQFVWVPVSNINGDGTGKIKVNGVEEEGVEVTLGRYSYKLSSPESPIKAQFGSEYEETTEEKVKAGTVIRYRVSGSEGDFYELANSRISNGLNNGEGTNTTAKNLKGFIESVRDHHGYYIARYEASYGSGYDSTNKYAKAKPLSKKSRRLSSSANGNMNYEEGTLWNYISQRDAATVSKNMYAGNSSVGVESDLVNSYAWDTALLYIQKMGNSSYATANGGGYTGAQNTGNNGDEKCHIHDMAGNLLEWSTEYCTYRTGSMSKPTIKRGGMYSHTSYIVPSRHQEYASVISPTCSFRPILYVV